MSQLARRENAPHRAAFVTSLSRWYIRRLLGNLPPFHPCLSAERRPRFVPCGTSSPYGHIPWKSRHGKPFLSSCQCTRNWPRSSGGTSRIIRECSSGDTEDRPAITTALLVIGAPDSVNFRAMGYVKFPLHFRQGGQHGIGGASGSFGVTGGQGYDWKYGGTGNTYWGGIDFYASRVTPVVGEVRPVNRAVRYLIRAR